ncbi:MAG TPA: hemerythrin domain-containing protein [Polyangiaceae bacterium]|jgi:hemerythrin-like domain-containing protein
MKATTLLERQHRNLQQLCETVEQGSASVRESLLPQLAGDLEAHMEVEEQVFFPAACAALHEDGWSESCHSWHRQARQSLGRAIDAPIGGAEFERAVGELRAAVEHHAEETAEELFPRLERALDGGEMRKLGVSMMSVYHDAVERPSPVSGRFAVLPGAPAPDAATQTHR